MRARNDEARRNGRASVVRSILLIRKIGKMGLILMDCWAVCQLSCSFILQYPFELKNSLSLGKRFLNHFV